MQTWVKNIENILQNGSKKTNSSFFGASFASNIHLCYTNTFDLVQTYSIYENSDRTKGVLFIENSKENILNSMQNEYVVLNFNKSNEPQNKDNVIVYGVFRPNVSLNNIHTEINEYLGKNIINHNDISQEKRRIYVALFYRYLDDGTSKFDITNNTIRMSLFHDEHNLIETENTTAMIVNVSNNVDTNKIFEDLDVDDSGNVLNHIKVQDYETNLYNEKLVDATKSILVELESDNVLRVKEYKENNQVYDADDLALNYNVSKNLPKMLLLKDTILPMSRGCIFQQTQHLNYNTNETVFKYDLINESGDSIITEKEEIIEVGTNFIVYLFDNAYDSLDLVDYISKKRIYEDQESSNSLPLGANIQKTLGKNSLVSYQEAIAYVETQTLTQRIILFMNEMNGYKQYERNMEILAQNNSIIASKLGDLSADDYDLTHVNNIINTSEAVTETPGMHLLYYISGTRINALDEEEYFVVNQNELDKSKNISLTSILETSISFKSYDQSLYLGNGSKDVVQVEQNINIFNQSLKAVLDIGSDTEKFEYSDYNENLRFVPSSTGFTVKSIARVKNIENIGLNTQNVDVYGVMAYQNIHIPYEKHNGVTITLHNHLKFVRYYLNNSETIKDLQVNLVVVPKEKMGLSNKMPVDVTNINDVNTVTYTDNDNQSAVDNDFVMARKVVSIYDADMDTDTDQGNDFYINDSTGFNKESSLIQNTSEDMFISLLVDLFRSADTSLVRPVVVLHEHESDRTVRNDLLNDEHYKIEEADFTKSIMAIRKICYYSYNALRNHKVNELGGIEYELTDYSLVDGTTSASMTLKNTIDSTDVITVQHFGLTDTTEDKLLELHKYAASKDGSYRLGTVVWQLKHDIFNEKIFLTAYPDTNFIAYSLFSVDEDTSDPQSYYYESAYDIKHNNDENFVHTFKFELDNYATKDDKQLLTRESPLLRSIFNGFVNERQNVFSIMRDNHMYNLTKEELRFANAYLNGKLHTFRHVKTDECGHENIQVETLYYFPSLLSRSLLEQGKSNVTNIYWILTDKDSGTFYDAPDTLVDSRQSNEEKNQLLQMTSYRKAFVSVLNIGLSSMLYRFIQTFTTITVPYNYRANGEVYDGAHMVYFLNYFQYSLRSLYNSVSYPRYCKFPIIWYEDDTFYYFTSKQLKSGDEQEKTKFDKVSKSFCS